MLRGMTRSFLILLALVASSVSLMAQAGDGANASALEVCCRPLPKWSASKDPILLALNKTIVTHLHHCYIDMGTTVCCPAWKRRFRVPGFTRFIRTTMTNSRFPIRLPTPWFPEANANESRMPHQKKLNGCVTSWRAEHAIPARAIITIVLPASVSTTAILMSTT